MSTQIVVCWILTEIIKNMFYFSVEGFRMAKNVVDSNSGKLESAKTRPWPNVFSIVGQRRRRWLTLNQHWLNMSWLSSNTRLWSNTGFMLTINPIPDQRFLFRPIGHERVYLPLCKLADTPFHIQGGDFLRRRTDLKFWKRRDLAQYYTQFRFFSANKYFLILFHPLLLTFFFVLYIHARILIVTFDYCISILLLHVKLW